jgi:hypothetical protein
MTTLIAGSAALSTISSASFDGQLLPNDHQSMVEARPCTLYTDAPNGKIQPVERLASGSQQQEKLEELTMPGVSLVTGEGIQGVARQ